MTEELIFRTQVQTGKSQKDTDALAESLSEVGKEADKAGTKGSEALARLNKKVEEGNFTMRQAAKIVQEYGAIALAAGRETPIGQEAIRLAGELTDTLGDLRTEITNAGTDGANLKATLELASTVTAGYGAFQGVLALTGTESEALTQTMVKLQAVQSILVGIETVRAALEKESLLMIKAKVVWNKVLTAGEYVYALAVGTTTGAMKALRIAMLAIPIVAIIAGIVALIGALSWFFSETEKAEAANNALNASFDRQNEALEANSRAFKRNADNKRAIMVSENATMQELFEFDKQRLQDEEVMRKKNVKLLESTIAQKHAVYKQALAEENEDLAKTIRDETTAMRKKYQGFRELDGQYAVDRKLLENKYRADVAKEQEEDQKEREQKSKEAAKRAKERRDAENQKRLEEERMYEDLIALNIEDVNLRKLTQLKLQHERELAEVRKKYGAQSKLVAELETKQANEKQALLDEFAKEEADAKLEADEKARVAAEAETEKATRDKKAELEGKLIQMREDFEAEQQLKKDLALFDMETQLAQTDLTAGEKFKIEQEYKQKIDEIDAENAEKEKERQKQIVEAGKQVLESGITAAESLTDAFFDFKLSKAAKGSAAELAIEKRKFEANKKLQIVQAVIQGTQATLAAYSSGLAIPIIGPVMGPLFAAAAAVTAGFQVAKIKNTSFEGGGSVTTPSASAPSVNPSVAVEGQNSKEPTTTGTAGLPGSQSQTNVVILQSELEKANAQSREVNIVSSVG